MRTLELLAPAKNLACGIAAIDHGADAVYIGAPRFGARAAAGNSIEDIRQLCRYAHRYGARVHVTVNTIVYDDELDDTLCMIRDLQRVGVDAFLLQDMGVLSALQKDGGDPAWKGELHSSTQCDARSAEKVEWLHRLGFKRVVLARELSAREIAHIHREVPGADLEVFVHGALCVSYSGVCYASQHCFQRSANRGECAQFCRLKFDLRDDDGRLIESQRHLLSLKDLCQIDHLEELADAGACSFKIEGRLKDEAYVKNVVAAYSQRLDALVARRPDEYRRASRGVVEYRFEPQLKKTFNRGFTTYFLEGRQPDIASFDTPKAIGEYVGRVKEMRRDSFNVAGTASFANGDGLCFINGERELEGFRVNRATGNRLYPYRMPAHLKPGTALYRNNDEAFEKLLAGKTAERRLPVVIGFATTPDGFEVTARPDGQPGASSVRVQADFALQEAKRPQEENIASQLAKLGNTLYAASRVEIAEGAGRYFVPNSLLSDLRRQLVAELDRRLDELPAASAPVQSAPATENPVQPWQPEYARYAYLYNIANPAAREFYRSHGMEHPAPAFELDRTSAAGRTEEKLLMQCRHCLRYSLGCCVKRGGKKPTWREPLHLELPDGRRFRLEFVCQECQMNLYSEPK